jgi:hypothetical protein
VQLELEIKVHKFGMSLKRNIKNDFEANLRRVEILKHTRTVGNNSNDKLHEWNWWLYFHGGLCT